MKTLKEIFPHISLPRGMSTLVSAGICEDSRLIQKGDIFFILPRPNFDIFSVLEGIRNKALLFVASKQYRAILAALSKEKPVIFVNDARKEFYGAVDRFYDFNATDFKFIGVTGTNGKTTITTLINYLITKAGEKTALLGTVNYSIGNKIFPASHTTPDYLNLRKIFNMAKKQKVRYVVMEVSSHAIAQARTEGITFKACIFTNLTRDHLDYHKTMESYFQAKRMLFTENPRAIAVINGDDPYGKKLLKDVRRPLSYGLTPGCDIRATCLDLGREQSEFILNANGKEYPVVTPLLGKHNVSNILAAIAVTASLGFKLKKVIAAIPSFRGADGRLERVHKNIFVDYAHTPDALSKALSALKEVGYGKIICVFGCGGNRDKGKRAMMGAIADKDAIFTFITSDNPRHEEAGEICRQIKEGFRSCRYRIVIDRREAIKCAIKLCANTIEKGYNNCCILVAGKGHEDYQILGDKKFPFKDSAVIKELLKNVDF
ncbi:MAG: UDP-N-acetylmuramoyl-L-alanyl-D-glutamate--2,6-diaminopimelate ligase [Candidatus Omnitrophica bacterium]|nr:UDP-N-acetylmuramoyl-L-alanyl-D-glutamate--2,6-diaminopimelate ligase [Candidatus Omnitrophota bacterium]